MTLQPQTAAPTQTVPRTPVGALGRYLGVMATWLVKNLKEALTVAVVGFVIGWVINFVLMAFFYDGFRADETMAATGQGNVRNGMLIWSLFSSVAFGLFAYRRAVGKDRFAQDMANFPGAIVGVFRKDGDAVWTHILWGAAISLLATFLIARWAGLGVSAVLAAAAFSPLGLILAAMITQLWRAIMRSLMPMKTRRATGSAGLFVGLFTSSLVLLAGFFIANEKEKLIVGALCLVAAVLVGRRQAQPPAAAAMLLFAPLLWLLFPELGLADDGGFKEAGGDFGAWAQGGGLGEITGYSVYGGVATAIGGLAGWMVGAANGVPPPEGGWEAGLESDPDLDPGGGPVGDGLPPMTAPIAATASDPGGTSDPADPVGDAAAPDEAAEPTPPVAEEAAPGEISPEEPPAPTTAVGEPAPVAVPPAAATPPSDREPTDDEIAAMSEEEYRAWRARGAAGDPDSLAEIVRRAGDGDLEAIARLEEIEAEDEPSLFDRAASAVLGPAYDAIGGSETLVELAKTDWIDESLDTAAALRDAAGRRIGQIADTAVETATGAIDLAGMDASEVSGMFGAIGESIANSTVGRIVGETVDGAVELAGMGTDELVGMVSQVHDDAVEAVAERIDQARTLVEGMTVDEAIGHLSRARDATGEALTEADRAIRRQAQEIMRMNPDAMRDAIADGTITVVEELVVEVGTGGLGALRHADTAADAIRATDAAVDASRVVDAGRAADNTADAARVGTPDGPPVRATPDAPDAPNAPASPDAPRADAAGPGPSADAAPDSRGPGPTDGGRREPDVRAADADAPPAEGAPSRAPEPESPATEAPGGRTGPGDTVELDPREGPGGVRPPGERPRGPGDTVELDPREGPGGVRPPGERPRGPGDTVELDPREGPGGVRPPGERPRGPGDTVALDPREGPGGVRPPGDRPRGPGDTVELDPRDGPGGVRPPDGPRAPASSGAEPPRGSPPGRSNEPWTESDTVRTPRESVEAPGGTEPRFRADRPEAPGAPRSGPDDLPDRSPQPGERAPRPLAEREAMANEPYEGPRGLSDRPPHWPDGTRRPPDPSDAAPGDLPRSPEPREGHRTDMDDPPYAEDPNIDARGRPVPEDVAEGTTAGPLPPGHRHNPLDKAYVDVTAPERSAPGIGRGAPEARDDAIREAHERHRAGVEQARENLNNPAFRERMNPEALRELEEAVKPENARSLEDFRRSAGMDPTPPPRAAPSRPDAPEAPPVRDGSPAPDDTPTRGPSRPGADFTEGDTVRTPARGGRPGSDADAMGGPGRGAADPAGPGGTAPPEPGDLPDGRRSAPVDRTPAGPGEEVRPGVRRAPDGTHPVRMSRAEAERILGDVEPGGVSRTAPTERMPPDAADLDEAAPRSGATDEAGGRGGSDDRTPGERAEAARRENDQFREGMERARRDLDSPAPASDAAPAPASDRPASDGPDAETADEPRPRTRRARGDAPAPRDRGASATGRLRDPDLPPDEATAAGSVRAEGMRDDMNAIGNTPLDDAPAPRSRSGPATGRLRDPDLPPDEATAAGRVRAEGMRDDMNAIGNTPLDDAPPSRSRGVPDSTTPAPDAAAPSSRARAGPATGRLRDPDLPPDEATAAGRVRAEGMRDDMNAIGNTPLDDAPAPRSRSGPATGRLRDPDLPPDEATAAGRVRAEGMRDDMNAIGNTPLDDAPAPRSRSGPATGRLRDPDLPPDEATAAGRVRAEGMRDDMDAIRDTPLDDAPTPGGRDRAGPATGRLRDPDLPPDEATAAGRVRAEDMRGDMDTIGDTPLDDAPPPRSRTGPATGRLRDPDLPPDTPLDDAAGPATARLGEPDLPPDETPSRRSRNASRSGPPAARPDNRTGPAEAPPDRPARSADDRAETVVPTDRPPAADATRPNPAPETRAPDGAADRRPPADARGASGRSPPAEPAPDVPVLPGSQGRLLENQTITARTVTGLDDLGRPIAHSHDEVTVPIGQHLKSGSFSDVFASTEGYFGSDPENTLVRISKPITTDAGAQSLRADRIGREALVQVQDQIASPRVLGTFEIMDETGGRRVMEVVENVTVGDKQGVRAADALQHREMNIEEAMAYDRGTRALNERGYVSLDLHEGNFTLIDEADGSRRLGVFDPGGIMPVRGNDPELARMIQSRINAPDPDVLRLREEFAVRVVRDDVRELLRQHVDGEALGIDLETFIFKPNMGRDHALVRELFSADDPEALYRQLRDAADR